MAFLIARDLSILSFRKGHLPLAHINWSFHLKVMDFTVPAVWRLFRLTGTTGHPTGTIGHPTGTTAQGWKYRWRYQASTTEPKIWF